MCTNKNIISEGGAMFNILVTDGVTSINLLKCFLTQQPKPDILITTCKYPDKTREVNYLSSKHNELKVFSLDLTQIHTYSHLAEKVEALVGDHGLNLLVNNIGFEREQIKIQDINENDFLQVLQLNLYAPVFLTQAMLPLLKRASQLNRSRPMGIGRAVVVNVSTSLGSVRDNGFGLYAGYRESKAALNEFSRSLCNEVYKYGIMVVVLNPDLRRLSNQENEFTIPDPYAATVSFIYKLSEKYNGQFCANTGTIFPW